MVTLSETGIICGVRKQLHLKEQQAHLLYSVETCDHLIKETGLDVAVTSTDIRPWDLFMSDLMTLNEPQPNTSRNKVPL